MFTSRCVLLRSKLDATLFRCCITCGNSFCRYIFTCRLRCYKHKCKRAHELVCPIASQNKRWWYTLDETLFRCRSTRWHNFCRYSCTRRLRCWNHKCGRAHELVCPIALQSKKDDDTRSWVIVSFFAKINTKNRTTRLEIPCFVVFALVEIIITVRVVLAASIAVSAKEARAWIRVSCCFAKQMMTTHWWNLVSLSCHS